MTQAASQASIMRAEYHQSWARWIGRSIDALVILALSYGAWYVIGTYWQIGIGFGWAAADSIDRFLAPGLLVQVADVTMFVLLTLIIEPFFIGLAGATPGKWMMGVRVVGADGRKLSYWAALTRTLMVVVLGLALYIPIATLVAMLLQFFRVSGGRPAAWDQILGSQVIYSPRPPLLWLVLIVIVVGARLALQWDDISARFSS